MVPPSAARSLPLSSLLSAADEQARAKIGEEASVRADGTVMAAVTSLPEGTRAVAAQWSVERARWEKLSESAEPPPPDEAKTAEDFAAMVVLDYVSGNLFRQRLELGQRGEIALLHNRGAWTEHLDPHGVEQLFSRVKRLSRVPPALRASLDRVGEDDLDAALRAGAFDDWLVQQRPMREALVRIRAASSVARSKEPPGVASTGGGGSL
jgi:hypothetical protein